MDRAPPRRMKVQVPEPPVEGKAAPGVFSTTVSAFSIFVSPITVAVKVLIMP